MIVENGVLTQLSVSQVESFDHKQRGGCERRWWFERAKDLRPEQNGSQTEGEAGHALLAHYFETGEAPKGRVKMGKAVTGALVKGELPTPGRDMYVEQRFSWQRKLDVNGDWIPLDLEKTLWLGDLPWEGFIDLTFRRDETPEIWDHKFSSDIHQYAKKPSELITTVQMPIYVMAMLRRWPDAKSWCIVHHYVSRSGVDSFTRSAVVDVDQVQARAADIEKVVARMKTVARIDQQTEVPFNRKACSAWNGCPHQSICQAFKEKHVAQLTAEEQALMDMIPSPAPKKKLLIGDAPIASQIPDSIPAAMPVEPPTTPTPAVEPVPAPVPTPEQEKPEPGPLCKCGAEINRGNGSKLQSGVWQHVGCPLTAPPPEPVKAKKAKKTEPELPLEAPKPKVEPVAPVGPEPELAPLPSLLAMPSVPSVLEEKPKFLASTAPAAVSVSYAVPSGGREALAVLLESLATLVRVTP